MHRNGEHRFPLGPVPAGPVSTSALATCRALLDSAEHIQDSGSERGLTEVTFLYLDGLGLWSDF